MFKSLFQYLSGWQVIASLAAVLFGLAGWHWSFQGQRASENIGQSDSAQLSVQPSKSATLSQSTSVTDIPPSTSYGLQTQDSSTLKNAPVTLQSNTNINDPTLSANPLVQSLLSSQ